MPKSANLESRVESILKSMTLAEKTALLSGSSTMASAGNERFGLPSLVMTDGPHGVTSPPATRFPSGVALAASWDTEMVKRVGAAMAEEVIAKGKDILLGPCVNMVRHPLGGRNFESMGEDPWLAGRLGIAYVLGVHSRGAGTSLKHYACNNQEDDRLRGSAEVDERTLREIYLPHFEMIVKEARPWTVMCSYNRINGVYASQNRRLLTDILKNEWGYDGVVVSDWGANHTIVDSVKNGLDLEMPGPARYYGKLLIDAVINRELGEADINAAARRMIRLALRSGRPLSAAARKRCAANSPEHQALSRRAAEASITLLKNDDALLPIDLRAARSIAVIGPNATIMPCGSGSSWCTPPYVVTPLDGIKALVGKKARIEYAQGCLNDPNVPAVNASLLRGTDGKRRGLTAFYFDNPAFAGKPKVIRHGMVPDFTLHGQPPVNGINRLNFSIRWQGTIRAPESGVFRVRAACWGNCRVVFDGRQIIDTRTRRIGGRSWFDAQWFEDIPLIKDRAYAITAEYIKTQNEESSHMRLSFGKSCDADQDASIRAAAELARRCDVAVVCAGFPGSWEGEANDRPHMDLPGRQNDLITAVAAANPNAVVLVVAGSPVTMPWIDRVPAVLYAWYPGMEGGAALARVITGAVNPSGKLPVTLPKRLIDTPAFLTYTPVDNAMAYGEGVFMGYRWYDARDIAPLFPFGHGLSYTTFEYGALHVPKKAQRGQLVRAAIEIRNSGKRAGAEVVQLYVRDMESSLIRPMRELKGFRKVFLKPGERAVVEFKLDDRSFAMYDPESGRWVVEPGEFVIEAGGSSREIQARAVVMMK